MFLYDGQRRRRYSPFRGRWDSKWSSKCKSKSWMVGSFQSTSRNRETEIPLYLAVQIQTEFWLNSNSSVSPGTNSNLMLGLQLIKISPPFRISICISTIISSLTFHGTGCNMMMPHAQVILQQYDVWCKDAFCAGYSTALISFSSGQYLHFNCRIALKNCGRLDLYDKTISLI